MAEVPLVLLRRQVTAAKKTLLPILLRARAGIESEIAKAARRKKIGTSAALREKLYRSIRQRYRVLEAEIDFWARELTEFQTIFWFKKARSDQGKAAGSITAFSREHVQNYFELIHPDNAERLAAVRTKAMAARDIQVLRQATIDAFRETSISGLTGAKLQRKLTELVQQRYRKIAGEGAPSWQFIDRAGRRWKTGNYFNMLTRTLTREVANQSYIDALLRDGQDLVSITGGADPCPVCARWRGLIVSLTGSDKRFPSYEDAREAGVFHPNCVCQLVHVDEELDTEEIEQQAGVVNPRTPTPEDWNVYADRIQEKAKEMEGVFSERQAVKINRSLSLTLEEANIMGDQNAIREAQGIFV